MPNPARIDRIISESRDARQLPKLARVWDPLVRLFHWSLVASFAIAWFTPRSSEDVHHWAGYAAAALILFRLLWGVAGTPYARFSQFVRTPRTVWDYLLAVMSGCEARHVGHNPAGGAMILALIAAMSATAGSGWMMTTDTYFGVDWVEGLHSLSSHGLLVLVVVHVGGVILASFRHKENLVRAMITGQKRAAGAGDVG